MLAGVRWTIGSLLLLLVAAAVGLTVYAERLGEIESALPEGRVPSIPMPWSGPDDTPGDDAPRAAPAARTSTARPGRIEYGPDGSVTITNIPDDPKAPRIVRSPDGGITITNQ